MADIQFTVKLDTQFHSEHISDPKSKVRLDTTCLGTTQCRYDRSVLVESPIRSTTATGHRTHDSETGTENSCCLNGEGYDVSKLQCLVL